MDSSDSQIGLGLWPRPIGSLISKLDSIINDFWLLHAHRCSLLCMMVQAPVVPDPPALAARLDGINAEDVAAALAPGALPPPAANLVPPPHTGVLSGFLVLARMLVLRFPSSFSFLYGVNSLLRVLLAVFTLLFFIFMSFALVYFILFVTPFLLCFGLVFSIFYLGSTYSLWFVCLLCYSFHVAPLLRLLLFFALPILFLLLLLFVSCRVFSFVSLGIVFSFAFALNFILWYF